MTDDQKRAAVEAMARAMTNPEAQEEWPAHAFLAEKQLSALLALGWRAPEPPKRAETLRETVDRIRAASVDWPADPIGEIERLNEDDRFRAGAEAMREAAAKACEAMEQEYADKMPSGAFAAGDCAAAIRALPIPGEGGGDG
ncbi:hypothetical protein [Amaricoccus solimangrovi]|uniref:Uncharacterized protein n=1 Tax=Amaricoccus solimangrovi TaxID=2589815 RepID=A0A501WXS3_9RHOB|nr:hypothetical protein [Amaricoccus solimangrovi]TPE53045.1 hypothetical protein FJM51_03195 [Amaricoccus solimangrovi]